MAPAQAAPTSAFAYIRRLPVVGDDGVHRILKELIACTEQNGFALAGVFYEERVGDRLSVWCELVAACRTERVNTVVVPSGEHFHHNPELAEFMRRELATTIHGTVLLVSDAVRAETSEPVSPDAR